MPGERLSLAALSGELQKLAGIARRLCPDRRDPERFHIERDELESRLSELADRVMIEATNAG